MRPPINKDGRELPPPPRGGRAAGRKLQANLERGFSAPVPVDQELDPLLDGIVEDSSLESAVGAEDASAQDASVQDASAATEAKKPPATAPPAHKRPASRAAKESRRNPSSS